MKICFSLRQNSPIWKYENFKSGNISFIKDKLYLKFIISTAIEYLTPNNYN